MNENSSKDSIITLVGSLVITIVMVFIVNKLMELVVRKFRSVKTNLKLKKVKPA